MLNSFQHPLRFLYANKEDILNQVQDDIFIYRYMIAKKRVMSVVSDVKRDSKRDVIYREEEKGHGTDVISPYLLR